MSDTGAIPRKSLETLFLRVAAQVFTMALGIILARGLGPAGKGLFTYVITVLAVLLPISGGASAAVSRQYGRLKMPSAVVYAGMMRFFSTICVPAALGLALYAALSHQLVLVASALVFLFASISQITLAFSLVDGDVRWANLQGLATAFGLAAVLAVVCLGLRAGIVASLIAWVGVYGAICAFSLLKIRRYGRGLVRADEALGAMRAQVAFAARVSVNQVLATLNYRIDLFIILALMGSRWLGIYSVAVGIGQFVWQLSRPLALTSYAGVTTGSVAQATRLTVLCVRHALFAVTLGALVLFFAGPELIRIVYGAPFADAGTALRCLLPGIIAYCTMPFFGQFFTLQLGKPFVMTAVTAVSTVVCAVFTYLAVPQWGILAGAIGTSLSYVAAFVLCAAYFCAKARCSPRALIAFGRDDLRRYVMLIPRRRSALT